MRTDFLTKVALIVISGLLYYSCNKEEDIITYDLEGHWKVISFDDYSTFTKITKTEDNTWPDFNNGDITVNFNPSGSLNGVISGINVTNSFSGEYLIDQNGGIEISNILTTLINELDWGRKFHSIIDAESYKIKNDRLIIYYNHKRNSMTLIKN